MKLIDKAVPFLKAALVPAAIVMAMGAMNGGQALAAGPFDVVMATLTDVLSSTWTLMLAVMVLVVAVWQLAHGGGYKTVGIVLGVLALALVGPGFLTTISTAMPDAAQMQIIADAGVNVAKPVQVLVAQN